VLKASGFIAADIASHGILLAFFVLPSRCSVACHATMGVSQRFVGQDLVVWISDSQTARHQPSIASKKDMDCNAAIQDLEKHQCC